ncbi:hypothetical protein HELRODRAFT_79940 [Helobdella robusta]|uniref:Bcl-2 homologous antagonist/killer n=1 Tax=Helobdella robusta TaxID=6412 RepID=T1G3V4_HELRO|nr:hypothetical protein HELRODRAFT_79940 [Helobdella robusta]ESO03638.1 hypothetical protein HELRODRAFT_79940 [Helobdella robusta]
MIVRPDTEAEIRPDTEENVVNQTDGIFRSFVTNMYVHDRLSSTADESPRFGELMLGAPENPLSRASEIGRRLAQIGDTVNERYSSEFNEMIKMLNPTPETAFEAFSNVAERLFRDGTIHWGRVLTLLCFGYRLAVAVLSRGIRGFFIKIIEYLIKYITISKIAQWIANQGGWVSSFLIGCRVGVWVTRVVLIDWLVR